MRPYLIRFARPANSDIASSARYDVDRQISVVGSGDDATPAVVASSPMVTKKADRERGEDQKDKWTTTRR